MIARTWRGWTTPAKADAYQHHYETEVTEHLRQIPGFQGARLLRHTTADEVMFTSITFFTNMTAVHAFAGENPDQAVLEEAARTALTHWDDHVTHHEVAANIPA